MDELSSLNRPTKIRKRKTRKCLNELRKRSKASIGFSNKIELSVENKNVYNLKKELSNNKLPNIRTKNTTKLTTERLTMKRGIFAKGVRSETVTRPALPEAFQARMDEDLYKIIDLANGEPKYTVTSSVLNNSNGDVCLNIDHEPILPSNEVKMNFANNSHTTVPNKAQDSNSDECHKIESPITSIPLAIEQEDSAIKKPVMYYKSIDSDSSSELEPNVALTHYNLYEEFCDKVPNYLNENFPIAANMNIEDDVKKYLKKVYAKSCQRESADNILDCIRNHNLNTRPKVETNPGNGNIIKKTMEESILLNPIQYLKSIQHNNIMQQSHSIARPNNESNSMLPVNTQPIYQSMRNISLNFPKNAIHHMSRKRYMSSSHVAKDYITRYHNKIAKILNSPEKQKNILHNQNLSNESSCESDFGSSYDSKNSSLVNMNNLLTDSNNFHTYNIMKSHPFP